MDDQQPAPTDRSSTPTEPELIDRFCTDLPGQPEIARDLLARYDEPHRHYHDRRHLTAVLDWIDRLAGARNDLFPVRLAAWFHDAVYAIPRGQVTNEEASARLALANLTRCGLEEEDLNEIARLVRLTKTHQTTGPDVDGALLCDADLAILAAPEDTYRSYIADVRAEYPVHSDEEFVQGRLQMLRTFGGRTVFHTAAGRELEAAAQANLVAEAYELLDRIHETAVEADQWPLTQRRPAARSPLYPQLGDR